jgi:hypothetical protein
MMQMADSLMGGRRFNSDVNFSSMTGSRPQQRKYVRARELRDGNMGRGEGTRERGAGGLRAMLRFVNGHQDGIDVHAEDGDVNRWGKGEGGSELRIEHVNKQ